MKKILYFLLLLAFLIPSFVMGGPFGVSAEGLKYTREEVEEWNPLDIELQTSSFNFLREIEGKAQFLRYHRIEGYKQKLKDTTRVYVLRYNDQDAYMAVDFESGQITNVNLFIIYGNVEQREENMQVIWDDFLDYDNNRMTPGYLDHGDIWYKAVIPHEHYTLSWGINIIPILDYGPWAILLAKYDN